MRIDAAISAEGLAKSFGKIKAMDGVERLPKEARELALPGVTEDQYPVIEANVRAIIPKAY